MANDFNFTTSGYTPSTPYDFNFGDILSLHFVLKGTSNDFNSVWILNNKMYVTSGDTLTTVDLTSHSLYDWYDGSHKGRGNETLNNDDIIDVNAIS